MVSVGVSALGRTDLHFIKACVNCEVFLIQKRVPDIKEFSDYFTFQQDSASAYHTQKMVDPLKCDTRLYPTFTVAFK